MQKKILTAFIFILLTFNSALPDSWRTIHENDGGASVNDGILIDNFHLLVAVGDSGKIYRVKDDGLWESFSPQGNTFNLSSIDYSFDDQSGVLTIMTVGSNGTILRSLDSSMSWEAFFQGSTNYTAIKYASLNKLWFVGGENGMLEYSPDNGNTWTPLDLMFGNLTIKGFVDTYSDGFFLYGVKNDSTFILKWDGESTFFPTPGDTIPDEIFTDAYMSIGGMGSNIYFCGVNAANSESNIYKKRYSGGQFNPAVMVYNGLPAGATSIGGYETMDYKTIMWVVTDNGQIWKSKGNDAVWNQVYDDNTKSLNALAVNPLGDDYGDYAYALGDGEFFLKYGFNLEWINPDQNEQFGYGLDRIEMFFTDIPDIQSIQNGVALSSSVSGKLNNNSAFDDNDSTHVFITFTRPNGDGGIVPGEHLSFRITGPMNSQNAQSSKTFLMSREYDILSLKPSDVKFRPKYTSQPLGNITTNYVTGFFNDDDNFDIITYSNDSLYCYAGNDTNGFDIPVAIAVMNPTNISDIMSTQLLKYDIDNDGKLDLILYDGSYIRLYRNQSSGNSFVFSEEASYTGVVIRTIVIEDLNKNGIPDFLVMGNSFFMLLDVNFSGFPSPTMDDLNYSFYNIMKVGDIDRDGWNETVLSGKDDELLIMRGQNDSTLYGDIWTAPANIYIDVQLADLNRDGLLEIVALKEDNEINIFKQNFGQPWDFTLANILPYQGTDTIKTLTIQDFGGHENQNSQRLMDIAGITNENRIIIFENMTNKNVVKK